MIERIEEVKLNYKNLIQKCLEVKRFRFFPLFFNSEIETYKTRKNAIMNRLNASFLLRLTDQVGSSTGFFRTMDELDLMDVLIQIWEFLNKFIEFFLKNNDIIEETFKGTVLEDEMIYKILLEKLKSKDIDEDIKNQIKFYYKTFSFFKITLPKGVKYGDKIWVYLNECIPKFTEEQKDELVHIIDHKSIKALQNKIKSINISLNNSQKIIIDMMELIEKAQKSIGGTKAFVIFRSLCKNANILKKNPLFLYNTIKEQFFDINYNENNLLENAVKVQKGIQSFIKDIKALEIQQIEYNMASYFLRDLVTEKDHLNEVIKIDERSGQFLTRFARYCFKLDSNAKKFIILTGLIMLPSLFKKEISNLISKADLKKNQLDKYEDCLDFTNHIKTKFLSENITWNEFIFKNKSDLDSYSNKVEINIIVKISIDFLFDPKNKEERYYKENFGILNEIFYLKCQSQCNVSSRYLCWSKFKPEINNERIPILLFCNIAQYCLLTNINNEWANLKEDSKRQDEYIEFLNRLKNPSYRNHLEKLISVLEIDPVKIYYASIHFKNKNKKLIITAYGNKKLEFVFSRSKEADIEKMVNNLGITSFNVKKKYDNESYGKDTTPAIDYIIEKHNFNDIKKICETWLELD